MDWNFTKRPPDQLTTEKRPTSKFERCKHKWGKLQSRTWNDKEHSCIIFTNSSNQALNEFVVAIETMPFSEFYFLSKSLSCSKSIFFIQILASFSFKSDFRANNWNLNWFKKTFWNRLMGSASRSGLLRKRSFYPFDWLVSNSIRWMKVKWWSVHTFHSQVLSFLELSDRQIITLKKYDNNPITNEKILISSSWFAFAKFFDN